MLTVENAETILAAARTRGIFALPTRAGKRGTP